MEVTSNTDCARDGLLAYSSSTKRWVSGGDRGDAVGPALRLCRTLSRNVVQERRVAPGGASFVACRAGRDSLASAPPAVKLESQDGRDQGPRRAAAVAASLDLSLAAADGDVDPPPG